MITPALLSALEPQFGAIEEAEISRGHDVAGWHSTCFSRERVALGSGCGASRASARRVALAETLERALFKRLCSEREASDFLLAEFPTTCGFAAGFERDSTRFRSLCEAVERWMLEQWIDRDCPFEPVAFEELDVSPIARHFAGSFEQVLAFQKSVRVGLPGETFALLCVVVVGLSGQGAFLGARVGAENDDLWTHPIVEAWRHKIIFENVKHKTPEALSEVRRKIQFFGFNRAAVLPQVTRARTAVWSEPRLRLAREYRTGVPGVFMWRHIVDGFKGWQLGPRERFLY